jgi:DOPA 4,5-dioxygenase
MNDQSNPHIGGYHAHVYYDSKTRPKAEHLAEAVADKFTVEIGGFFDEPVGPHPVANLAIVFAPAEFAGVVPWLMLNRNGLDVLVHPLTDDSVRDHDSDGLWLGKPVELRLHGMSPDYAPDLLPTTTL